MAENKGSKTLSIDSNIINPLLQHDVLSAKYKNDTPPKESKLKSSDIGLPQKYAVTLYISVFFFAMIAHELALEAVSSNFPDLESLASSVTLFQFGFCFMLPLIISRGKVCETFPRSLRETLPYIRLSFLVFGATGAATQSLRYVSYPTKVVFKSAKLIPTMLISTLVYRNKKYTHVQYLAAFFICIGAAGYGFNPEKGGSGNDTSYLGIILLTTSVICDAIVPNVQQRLMAPSISVSSTKGLPMVNGKSTSSVGGMDLSAQAVMINTNTIGFAMLLVFMFFSGSLNDAISAGAQDISLLVYLVSIGLGLSTAVLAYTKLIQSSGPVAAVAVTTLRKVATMMLSYIVFPKPISMQHVISGILVLIGILISSFCKSTRTLQ